MITFHQVQRKFPECREVSGKNGLEFNVHCPKPHKKGGTYKLYINSESGAFCCQDCGYSGNALYEFFDSIQEEFSQYYVQRDAAPAHRGATARRGGAEWAPGISSPGECVPFAALPADHPAVEYLSLRGFDIEELRGLEKTREIYYCSRGQHAFPPPKFKGSTTGRIVFPFYMMGAIKGWQARQIERVIWEDAIHGVKEVWNGFDWKRFQKVAGDWEDKEVPKYYTCPGTRRSEILIGFDRAIGFDRTLGEGYKSVAVVEGPLDYYRVGAQCVGTMGKNITIEQINLMKNYFEKLFILRDPEIDPNEERFKRMLNELNPLKVFHLALANGKDPGATPRESAWQQIAEEETRTRRPAPNFN